MSCPRESFDAPDRDDDALVTMGQADGDWPNPIEMAVTDGEDEEVLGVVNSTQHTLDKEAVA